MLRVRLHGLGREELNGAYGEIIGQLRDGRYPVRLATPHAALVGGPIKVKAINVQDAWLLVDKGFQPLSIAAPSLMDANLVRCIVAACLCECPVRISEVDERLRTMHRDVARFRQTCTEVRTAVGAAHPLEMDEDTVKAEHLLASRNPYALLDMTELVSHLARMGALISQKEKTSLANLSISNDSKFSTDDPSFLETACELCIEHCCNVICAGSKATRCSFIEMGVVAQLERLAPLVKGACSTLAMHCYMAHEDYVNLAKNRLAEGDDPFIDIQTERIKAVVARTRKVISAVLKAGTDARASHHMREDVVRSACIACTKLFETSSFYAFEDTGTGDWSGETDEREKMPGELLNVLSAHRSNEKIAAAAAEALLAFIDPEPTAAYVAAVGEVTYRNDFMRTQPEMYGVDTPRGQQGTLLTERRIIYDELHEHVSGMRSCPNGVLQNALQLASVFHVWHRDERYAKGTAPLPEALLELPLLVVQIYRRSFELLDTKSRVWHLPYLFASTHRYHPLPNLTWLLCAVARAEPDLKIVGEAPLAFAAMIGMLPWQLDSQVNYKHTDKALVKRVDEWLGDSDRDGKSVQAALALLRRCHEIVEHTVHTVGERDDDIVEAGKVVNALACGYGACVLLHVATLSCIYDAPRRRQQAVDHGAIELLGVILASDDDTLPMLSAIASYCAAIFARSHGPALTAAGVSEAAQKRFDLSNTEDLYDEMGGGGRGHQLGLSRVRLHLAAMYRASGTPFLESLDPRKYYDRA